jgi:hypothetical protein
VRAVAVGRAAGLTTLVVPAGRTYMGSTAPDTIDSWDAGIELRAYCVPEVTLDSVVRTEGLAPDLVKIDTEGSELAIRVRPLLVLESWPGSASRVLLFHLLTGYGYRLRALRFGAHPSGALTRDGFVRSAMTNFLARPSLPGL